MHRAHRVLQPHVCSEVDTRPVLSVTGCAFTTCPTFPSWTYGSFSEDIQSVFAIPAANGIKFQRLQDYSHSSPVRYAKVTIRTKCTELFSVIFHKKRGCYFPQWWQPWAQTWNTNNNSVQNSTTLSTAWADAGLSPQYQQRKDIKPKESIMVTLPKLVC